MNLEGATLPRIPVAEPVIGERELRYVQEALRLGEVSSRGRFVAAFEERFASACGVRYGVATCNGTCALHLALLATGIGPGDEVLVPALTFVATANAARYVGARPVFVDVDPRYWGMDVGDARRKITRRTRAVIPVHLYGHPVDMDPLLELAERHRLVVIEDAAEAHGARYKGRPVGGIGTAAIFSFYGNKILTTGEGGMVLTNDPEVAERARQLRDQGSDPVRRYWHPIVGYNYRMTNLQAALGLAQVEQLDGFLQRKREIAAFYRRLLQGVSGLAFQSEEPWAWTVWWMFSILVAPEERDALGEFLDSKGIETRPVFHPLHTLPPYQERGVACPVAEDVARRGLNLPSGVPITEAEMEEVAASVREFFQGRARSG